jgi:glucose-1-phosphate thymidylyltransferase
MEQRGNVRRAVVLAAGRASRMREPDAAIRLDAAQEAAADAGRKAMMPISGDRPFLDYLLSSLADAGITEVCLVVPPESGEIRRRYRGTTRLSVAFAAQPEPGGTADALLAAEEFVGREEFLALNGDNYYPPSAYRGLQDLGGPGLPVFERKRLLGLSNIPVLRIAQYAIVEISDGYLEKIVEKPGEAAIPEASERILVSMNLWRFRPSILEACRRVALSTRGERELPQAVQLAIGERRERFRAVFCGEGVLDLSTRGDIASVAERLRDVEVRL